MIANEDHGAIEALERGSRLDVPARAHWRRVERAANRVGLTMPVLPDYLHLSVGGTLSVGGYGIDSIRHGGQVDHVERLEIITPGGERLRCSSTERPDLFSRALAGLGHAGVIERAVLRCVPHQPWTTFFTCRHASLAALVASCGWLVEAADGPALFKGVAARGRFTTFYGQVSPNVQAALRVPPPGGIAAERPRRWISPRYRALRALSVRAWVASFGRARRCWSDYVMTHAALEQFSQVVDELRARDAFGGCLASIYLLGIRRLPRAVALPFDPMTGLDAPVAFGIGLYSMVPAGRADLLAQVRAASRRCLEACLTLGGRPYRYGCHDVSDLERAALYGDAGMPVADSWPEFDPARIWRSAS